MRSRFKTFTILSVGAILVYSAVMILIRLRITELGYEFEEAKAYERLLREEQLQLKVDLAHKVSSRDLVAKWQTKGFSEPEPRQIVVIP